MTKITKVNLFKAKKVVFNCDFLYKIGLGFQDLITVADLYINKSHPRDPVYLPYAFFSLDGKAKYENYYELTAEFVDDTLTINIKYLYR